MVVKTGFSNHYGLSTGFAVLKIGLPKLCKPLTGFVVVKTGYLNNYRLLSSLRVVKTGLSYLYRPSTSFLGIKNVFNKLCGSQNGSVESLALQNILTEHLQAFNRVIGVVTYYQNVGSGPIIVITGYERLTRENRD